MKGNINAIDFLAKKYSKENDTENTFKYVNALVESGNYSVSLKYAIICFKEKKFDLAFKYFSIVFTNYNHQIANYFCLIDEIYFIQNRHESFEIY